MFFLIMFKDNVIALGRKIVKIEPKPEWEIAARLLLVWFRGARPHLRYSSYIAMAVFSWRGLGSSYL